MTAAKRFDHLRDPASIYRASFAAVRAATDLSSIPQDLEAIALRMVHACAQPEIIAHLAWSAQAGRKGRQALAEGAPIFTDAKMVADGVIGARLAQNQVICTLDDPRAATLAEDKKTTRSAAAVELWGERLGGAVVAIGNAPTALFRLLELLAEGAPRPALIIGMPVGFIGAAESKEALIAHDQAPYVTLRGRLGGSALAAAAVNALAEQDS